MTQLQHHELPLYQSSVGLMKLYKGGLENYPLDELPKGVFDSMISQQEVKELVRTVVMDVLGLIADPRKQDTIDFIEQSSTRIFDLQKPSANIQSVKASPLHISSGASSRIDKHELKNAIFGRLAFYKQIFAHLPNLKAAPTETISKELTLERVEKLVRLATLRILGKSGVGQIGDNPIINETISEVSSRMLAYQTIPRTGGFHKLDINLRRAILESANFGSGFDGRDLEKIGYNNIKKFTPQALRALLKGLDPNDEGREDIIQDLARNLPGVDGITLEMVEAGFRGHEATRTVVTVA